MRIRSLWVDRHLLDPHCGGKGRISAFSSAGYCESELAGAFAAAPAEAAERYLLESSVAAAAVQKRLLRQRLVCCVAQAQADVLLSRLHLCLPGWRAAEGRRRRAEQQFDWQEAARARGLAWDARGTDSSDFDEPQGAHRHH